MAYFTECRNESLNHVANQTNNLIIRLDKLINRHTSSSNEDLSRKDYEKKVVPWSDNAEYPHCRVCNSRFSLTKRRHHCRLCGKIMCNACSLFLPFSSARKLTGPEFSSPTGDSSLLMADGDGQDSGGIESKSGGEEGGGGFTAGKNLAAMALARSGDSLLLMKSKLGSMLPFGMGETTIATSTETRTGEDNDQEKQLRICDMCKQLLDRREEAMDLRTAHSVFVDVYQKLRTLLTQIANLAPSYRHMTESLNNGESIYSLESANELRKKLVGCQREIASLSERIEQWGLNPEDPLVATHPPGTRALILQKNIRLMAVGTLQDAVVGMPDLPTEEQYAELRVAYKERLARRREQIEREQAEIQMRSTANKRCASPTSSLMSSSSSSLLMERQRVRPLRPSSSLNALAKSGQDDGWVSNSPFQLNPFKEEEAEELNAIQQQYLNIKSFLQQAAQAGRLEEVEILEKNLMEMELELKRLHLPTPRLID